MREIRYEPKNIRETLVELKDSSELAVDLAYSAVLFDKQELAEEVEELAARANYLRYHARIALMLAAKNTDDAESLVGIFQVVDGAVDITEAAADIARIPLRGVHLPSAFRVLPDAEEQFVRLTLAESSPLAGRTLQNLGLDVDKGISIIALRRNDDWIFAPSGEDEILSGDVLFARGPAEGIADFHRDATGEQWEPPELPEEDSDIERAIAGIVELKDVSELAVGLSYSAALYDSETLAEEVEELEERADTLRAKLETWVVSDGEHSDTDPATLRGLFHLAVAAEVISDAALDIAEVVFRDVKLHPVFGRAIKESREVITSVQITHDSELVGRTISEFEHDVEGGMTVLALRRRGEWLYTPSEETEIESEDRLVLKGPNRGVELIQQLVE